MAISFHLNNDNLHDFLSEYSRERLRFVTNLQLTEFKNLTHIINNMYLCTNCRFNFGFKHLNPQFTYLLMGSKNLRPLQITLSVQQWPLSQICSFNYIQLYSFRRSGSCTPPTTPVSHDMIELTERESNFASTVPFSCLKVIATLGVGGFGRVELVRSLLTIILLPLHHLKHSNKNHFHEVKE